MAIFVRNASEADKINNFKVPTRADGTFYLYEMICDNGWSRVYDDTIEGLLNFLIRDYSTMTDEEKLTARIRHAVDCQVRLQAQINAFFSDEPRTPVEDAILNGPRTTPPMITQWDCAVPLLLIDSFYAPHTNIERPFSGLSEDTIPENLWWLTPCEGEMEYLRSLHQTSIIDLNIAKDVAV